MSPTQKRIGSKINLIEKDGVIKEISSLKVEPTDKWYSSVFKKLKAGVYKVSLGIAIATLLSTVPPAVNTARAEEITKEITVVGPNFKKTIPIVLTDEMQNAYKKYIETGNKNELDLRITSAARDVIKTHNISQEYFSKVENLYESSLRDWYDSKYPGKRQKKKEEAKKPQVGIKIGNEQGADKPPVNIDTPQIEVVDLNTIGNELLNSASKGCLTKLTNGCNYTVMDLVENKKADVNFKNSEGKTPLMLAIKGNYPKTVEYLLSRGANPEEKDREGNTPLMLAESLGNEKIIHLLKGNKQKLAWQGPEFMNKNRQNTPSSTESNDDFTKGYELYRKKRDGQEKANNQKQQTSADTANQWTEDKVDVDALKKKVESKKAELNAEEERIKAERKKLEGIDENISKIADEMNGINSKLNEAKKSSQEKDQNITELSNQIDEMRKKLEQLENNMKQLKEDKEQLEKDIKGLEEEKNKKRDELKKLEDSLSDVEEKKGSEAVLASQQTKSEPEEEEPSISDYEEKEPSVQHGGNRYELTILTLNNFITYPDIFGNNNIVESGTQLPVLIGIIPLTDNLGLSAIVGMNIHNYSLGGSENYGWRTYPFFGIGPLIKLGNESIHTLLTLRNDPISGEIMHGLSMHANGPLQLDFGTEFVKNRPTTLNMKYWNNDSKYPVIVDANLYANGQKDRINDVTYQNITGNLRLQVPLTYDSSVYPNIVLGVVGTGSDAGQFYDRVLAGEAGASLTLKWLNIGVVALVGEENGRSVRFDGGTCKLGENVYDFSCVDKDKVATGYGIFGNINVKIGESSQIKGGLEYMKLGENTILLPQIGIVINW
ncbi:MAG: ankyrin repeat domain-containing protein [Candidatus Micrarchaeia archaeon]